MTRTITTSKGETFTTDLDDWSAIYIVSKLDNSFAQSLFAQYKRNKGRLSPAQWPWVFKLAEESRNPKPQPQPQQVASDLSGVLGIFNKVRQHLKFPKVVLTSGSTTIKLYVAGDRAKHPGSLTVLRQVGAEFQWEGRVMPDGTATLSRSADQSTLGILRAFAADPEGVAAASGKMTGCCSFCHLPLSDERSIAVGYGPTCAQHWGLPWGTGK